jgi:hypothetical protein
VKNSFFLLIPEQQKNKDLLVSYEKAAVNLWVSELPTANPRLATRLFYDFIEAFNTVEMSASDRLDILEILEPNFFTIEDYLRSRLIQSGFPKGENEQKILDLIVSIQKHFTISYWMVLKELTGRDAGWFKGKDTSIALQRTIRVLSGIVITHYMMFLPVPDWIWIDLHSLYKLSVKIKKDNTKVSDEFSGGNKVTTAEECYKQILLLSLSDPSGLMQKEIQQVYHFIGRITPLIKIENKAIGSHSTQCVILMDEDVQPYFDYQGKQHDSSALYLNLLKLYKGLEQADKFCSQENARFSSMHILRNATEKLPAGLFDYLLQCWKGVELKGVPLFSDRLDRYIAIGLDATHSLQSSLDVEVDSDLEVLAESYSDSELSCKFQKEGVLSIGSLVSFRQTKELETKRSLGVVIKITMPKQDGHIVFELTTLTAQSYAVTYMNIDNIPESESFKGLLYVTRNDSVEKSFIIVESFMYKNNDVLRVFMNDDNFPVVLGDRKNIGLGYWQFECRRIEERQAPKEKSKKKGYDFI